MGMYTLYWGGFLMNVEERLNGDAYIGLLGFLVSIYCHYLGLDSFMGPAILAIYSCYIVQHVHWQAKLSLV